MWSRDHLQLLLEMLRTANIRNLTVWFAPPRQTNDIGDDKTVMPPQRATESDTVMCSHGSANPPTHLQYKDHLQIPKTAPSGLGHVPHLMRQCLGQSYSPPRATIPPVHPLPHNYPSNFPLVTMERPKITPKLPLPRRRSPPKSRNRGNGVVVPYLYFKTPVINMIELHQHSGISHYQAPNELYLYGKVVPPIHVCSSHNPLRFILHY